MKRRLIFLLCMLLGPPSLAADTTYRVIYQVQPSITGFDKEFAEIKPLYKDTLAQIRELDNAFPRDNPSDREVFGMDAFDLNGDGVKEIFVWTEDRAVCGANVCPLDIYQREANNLVRIGSGIMHGGPAILASKTHGYHDLAYYAWGDGEEYYNIYRFDGGKYKLANSISIDRISGMNQE